MLIVGFKQIQSRNQNLIPPVFIKIDKTILMSTVEQLLTIIYKQFKPYLSPFITTQNLQIQSPNGKSLKLKLPLFMYFDYKEYQQFFSCQINSYDSINRKNHKFDNLYCNAIVRKISLAESQSQQEIDKQIKILSKNLEADLKKLDELIEDKNRVYINGREISNKANKPWSTLIKQNWQRLQNIRDKCLYMFIDNQ